MPKGEPGESDQLKNRRPEAAAHALNQRRSGDETAFEPNRAVREPEVAGAREAQRACISRLHALAAQQVGCVNQSLDLGGVGSRLAQATEAACLLLGSDPEHHDEDGAPCNDCTAQHQKSAQALAGGTGTGRVGQRSEGAGRGGVNVGFKRPLQALDRRRSAYSAAGRGSTIAAHARNRIAPRARADVDHVRAHTRHESAMRRKTRNEPM